MDSAMAQPGRSTGARTPQRLAPVAGWLPGLAGIFVLALALRLIFLFEISSSPAWGALFIDSAWYDAWARQIAGGNWLGTGVFTMAPLYPYFLGAVYALLGAKLTSALLVQAALGSASCVLLAIAGRFFLDARTGVIAGLLLALYPAAIFSDSLIQKSVLDIFLVCLLLAALGLALDAPSSRRWFLAGVALGGLMLTRENAVLLVPVVALALITRGAGVPGKTRVTQAAAGLAGLALLLAPVAARNWHEGGEFFLTTAQFGYNFAIGNNPQATGTYRPLIAGEQGTEAQDARSLAETALQRKLSAGEVSGYWRDRALGYIRDYPTAWLRLLARKTLLLMNALELPDSYDQYTYADWSLLLRMLTGVLHFGVLLPLAGAGATLTWDRRKSLWPLHAMAVLYAGSVVLFFVLARYRLPLVPILALFAAAFIAEFAASLARRKPWTPSLLRAACAIGILAVVAQWPIAEASGKPGFKATMLSNIAVSVVEQPGRSEEAIGLLTEALRLNPRFGPGHYYLGIGYKNAGRFPKSLVALRTAAALLPDVPDSYFQIGEVLALTGKSAEALPWYRRALALDPEEPNYLVQTAKALDATGDVRGAQDARARAAAIVGARRGPLPGN